jgi:hypothetical protein
MRTWLHHRWGRGLEIEAAPLPHDRQMFLSGSFRVRFRFIEESLRGRSFSARTPTVRSFLFIKELPKTVYISIPFSAIPLPSKQNTRKPLHHSPRTRMYKPGSLSSGQTPDK